MSLAEVFQLCFRLDPYASATSPSVLTQPLPDSEVPATECAHLCPRASLWMPSISPWAWVGVEEQQGLSSAMREKDIGTAGSRLVPFLP